MTSVSSVVEKYQKHFSGNLGMTFSKKKSTLGQEGVGNRMFYLSYLCQDKTKLLKFLIEARLIKGELACLKCGGKMIWRVRNSCSDGYVWYCENKRNGKLCREEKSIRHGSWFGNSRLTIEEILILTYELIKGETTGRLCEEYYFSSHTLSDWRRIVNETVLNFMETLSQKIGGHEKFVEISESKCGQRKYNKGHENSDEIMKTKSGKRKLSKRHLGEGKWVFGGIERGSGKLFLVVTNDRSEETLLKVIETWVEKGTTICFDSRKAYDRLGPVGYDLLKVNHNMNFVDSSGSTSKDFEICSSNYKQTDFHTYLASYVFKKYCEEKKIDRFNAFLEIARDIKWEELYNIV